MMSKQTILLRASIALGERYREEMFLIHDKVEVMQKARQRRLLYTDSRVVPFESWRREESSCATVVSVGPL